MGQILIAFFSFRGTLNRKEYWLRILPAWALAMAAIFGISTKTDAAAAALLICLVLSFVAIVSAVIRRLRDIDASALWVIPAVFIFYGVGVIILGIIKTKKSQFASESSFT